MQVIVAKSAGFCYGVRRAVDLAEHAVAAGERSFAALAVAGGPQGQSPAGDCFPCGICRQALSEFCAPQMPVLVVRGEGDWRWYTLEELLPYAFRL